MKMTTLQNFYPLVWLLLLAWWEKAFDQIDFITIQFTFHFDISRRCHNIGFCWFSLATFLHIFRLHFIIMVGVRLWRIRCKEIFQPHAWATNISFCRQCFCPCASFANCLQDGRCAKCRHCFWLVFSEVVFDESFEIRHTVVPQQHLHAGAKHCCACLHQLLQYCFVHTMKHLVLSFDHVFRVRLLDFANRHGICERVYFCNKITFYVPKLLRKQTSPLLMHTHSLPYFAASLSFSLLVEVILYVLMRCKMSSLARIVSLSWDVATTGWHIHLQLWMDNLSTINLADK